LGFDRFGEFHGVKQAMRTVYSASFFAAKR
jgi:hypothetical protein